MAVCVGCGLEVNNGLLEVNVCGTPVTPNTTTGGLQCDTTTENGCLKVVLNDSHAGCGLNAASGALEVDPCLNGGILCGATDDDPEDNCIYVNVQGQYATVCKSLGTGVAGSGVREPAIFPGTPGNGTGGTTACLSPNPGSAASSPCCNGLVRTCDGLWAPPSLPSVNFSCGQIQNFGGPINASYTQALGPQAGLLGAIPDGFAPLSSDLAYGISGNEVIIGNAFVGDDCNPIDAMSFTAFNMAFQVNAGELWRFSLHERICFTAGVATPPTTCTGPWITQAFSYIDRRNEGTSAFETVQINDNSTWRFEKGLGYRMEAMITINRLVGGPTANANNPVTFANFQYRNMGHGYHHQLNQTCEKKSTSL